MAYDFDLFVIGGGPGGLATSRKAAALGAKVALAESKHLGGTCANKGCVPKKMMVYASRFSKYASESAGYGWNAEPAKFDWKAMITDIADEVKRLNGSFEGKLEKAGITVFEKRAKLLDAHTVDLGEKKVSAENIVVAVGGAPMKPEIPGLEHAITSNDIFEMQQQPEHIVILGGGYVGCEFASVMLGLGTQVTQVIRRPLILNGFDQDVRRELHSALVERGINIINNAEIVQVEKNADGKVSVTIEKEVAAAGDAKADDQSSPKNENKNKSEQIIIADVVNLAATGRRPQLDNLGLENTAVETRKGAIATDKYGQTAEPSIYAIGDCTERLDLAPVAIAEGKSLANRLYGGQSAAMSYQNIPSAVFTTPESASVGLTEAAAKEKYGEDNIRTFCTRFSSLYYSLTDSSEKTLMKLVVQAESDKVLGVHIVGDHAGEMIQGIAIALNLGATKASFDATVALHPTSAEELVTMD